MSVQQLHIDTVRPEDCVCDYSDDEIPESGNPPNTPCGSPRSTHRSTPIQPELSFSGMSPEMPSLRPDRPIQQSEDFLDAAELQTYCRMIANLETRVLSSFQLDVMSNPSAAFRNGPRDSIVIKARSALAVFYMRLARTIRRLGFEEGSIVVPAEVRQYAQDQEQGFRPFGRANWKVNDEVYNVYTESWESDDD